MNDIIIKGKRIKIEIYKLLICFVIANILNLFSIIKFNTKWIEIFTQLHWVLILTGVLYFVSLVGLALKTFIFYVKPEK